MWRMCVMTMVENREMAINAIIHSANRLSSGGISDSARCDVIRLMSFPCGPILRASLLPIIRWRLRSGREGRGVEVSPWQGISKHDEEESKQRQGTKFRGEQVLHVEECPGGEDEGQTGEAGGQARDQFVAARLFGGVGAQEAEGNEQVEQRVVAGERRQGNSADGQGENLVQHGETPDAEDVGGDGGNGSEEQIGEVGR